MLDVIEELMHKGVELHKSGKVEVAAQLYSVVLKEHPEHPDANHNMGVLAVNNGKMPEALRFFETALEANADVAQFWVSYIDALIGVGRMGDAQAVLDQAKSNGAQGEGFDQLEARLNVSGQAPFETITRALEGHQDQPNILEALKPDHTESYNNLGAIQMSNPYKEMHVSKFWSTAVAERVVAGKGFELMDAGVLFESGKKVASVGSCFAKEIGKKLVENGMDFATYQTQESEPDSFGLGNVYTTRHFLQWMEFSIGERNWSSNMHQINNGVVEDLTMNSQYHYSDYYECINNRTSIALNLLNVLRSVDVLVLTLGLTEMWQSPCNEAFAMCPGTSKGIFSHEHHFFKNLTFGEVTSDLRSIWQIIQKINPKLEIILTVSPVPLTATAAKENVLVASAKSKSTLRAAAGEFIDSDEKLHYFPSYELITHVNDLDWRFNKNLRTISSEGVSYVMSHLFEGETFNIKKSDNAFNQMLDEDLCEEARLGQFNQRKSNMSLANNKEIFVIGDSHMGRLCKAMVEEKISFHGGMIMNGSGFSDHKFKLNSKTIFTVEEKPEYALFWEKTFAKLSNSKSQVTILTNIGLQTHRVIGAMCRRLGRGLLSLEDVEKQFKRYYVDQLKILSELKKYGDVHLIEDPNFYIFNNSDNFQVMRYNFEVYVKFLDKHCQNAGLKYHSLSRGALVSMLEKTGSSFAMDAAVEADGFHGTDIFYQQQLKTLKDVVDLK